MPADAILDAHNRRLRELDPLLSTAPPLPAAGRHDVPIECPGGSGLARLIRVDLDSFAATWSAAEEHRLLARATDVYSMADLLEQWEETLLARATAGDPDSEAVLNWPSRDAAMVRPFRSHGLVPQATIAVRPSGRSTPPTKVADVTVRPLRAGDVDAATRLWLAEVAWDQQFGGPIQRASTEPNIRNRLAHAARADDPWSWVAEQAGRLVGLVVVSPPAATGRVAPLVSVDPVAYVDSLLVVDGQRGSGVGAALVRHVHAALDDGGVAATLLHYACMNPLSGPFWHRWGYRPLWTIWSRRPARPAAR